jgi:hypothetical protein
MTSTLSSGLSKLGDSIAAQVEKKLGKADAPNIDDLMSGLDFSVLVGIAEDLADDISPVATDAAKIAVTQVSPDQATTLTGVVNKPAVEWASKRAGQLVSLSGSPSITEATRDMIKGTLSVGLDAGMSSSEIADLLQSSHAFSEDRAALIANTEIRRANSAGAVEGYKVARDAGVLVKKEWLTDDDPCPECEENAGDGAIDLDDTFSSGDSETPAHPHCDCATAPVVETEGSDDE